MMISFRFVSLLLVTLFPTLSFGGQIVLWEHEKAEEQKVLDDLIKATKSSTANK